MFTSHLSGNMKNRAPRANRHITFSRWKTFWVVQPYSGKRSWILISWTCARLENGGERVRRGVAKRERERERERGRRKTHQGGQAQGQVEHREDVSEELALPEGDLELEISAELHTGRTLASRTVDCLGGRGVRKQKEERNSARASLSRGQGGRGSRSAGRGRPPLGFDRSRCSRTTDAPLSSPAPSLSQLLPGCLDFASKGSGSVLGSRDRGFIDRSISPVNPKTRNLFGMPASVVFFSNFLFCFPPRTQGQPSPSQTR